MMRLLLASSLTIETNKKAQQTLGLNHASLALCYRRRASANNGNNNTAKLPKLPIVT